MQAELKRHPKDENVKKELNKEKVFHRQFTKAIRLFLKFEADPDILKEVFQKQYKKMNQPIEDDEDADFAISQLILKLTPDRNDPYYTQTEESRLQAWTTFWSILQAHPDWATELRKSITTKTRRKLLYRE